MGGDAYTAGEVVWLLSLTPEEVELEDVPGSILGQPDGGGEGDGHRIPTVARWSEVQRARERVIRRKARADAGRREVEALELVARGYTQQEAAAIAETSQPTVSRRVRTGLREILAELGGEAAGPAETTSHLELCLACGERPRARVPAVRRKRPGMEPLELRPERPIGLCVRCASAVEVFAVAPCTGAGRPREVLDYIAWVELAVEVHELRSTAATVASLPRRALEASPAAARGQRATLAARSRSTAA